MADLPYLYHWQEPPLGREMYEALSERPPRLSLLEKGALFLFGSISRTAMTMVGLTLLSVGGSYLVAQARLIGNPYIFSFLLWGLVFLILWFTVGRGWERFFPGAATAIELRRALLERDLPALEGLFFGASGKRRKRLCSEDITTALVMSKDPTLRKWAFQELTGNVAIERKEG